MLALQRLPQLQALELSDVAGPTAAQLDDTLRRCGCMVVPVVLCGCACFACACCSYACCQFWAGWLPCQSGPQSRQYLIATHRHSASCSLTALHLLSVQSHSPACKTPALRSLACLPRIRRLAVAQAHQLQSFVGLTNLGSLRGEAAGEEGAPGVHAVGSTGPAAHGCSPCCGAPARQSLLTGVDGHGVLCCGNPWCADLEALELRGAGVTNSIMARLAALPALAQVCHAAWCVLLCM